MEKEEKISGIKQKLEELHRNYGINRLELGEIMVIMSTTLLIMSIHGYYSFNAVHSEVSNAEDDLKTTLGMMETDGFQRGMQALKDLETTTLGQRVEPALHTFQQSKKSINATERAAEEAAEKKSLYQWLSLLGILGAVTGVIIIIME